jgi:hypothetical protein
MSRPAPNPQGDAETLRQYAAALWARIPAVDPAAALAAQRARPPAAGGPQREGPPVAVEAPARAVTPVPSFAGRRQRPDHVVLGLGAVARGWPPARFESLDEFADLLRSADFVWGGTGAGSAHERAAREQLADRRDEAVRLVSVRFYSLCRACGVDDDLVEEGGQELAGWIGERLYGSSKRVFAPKRGRFVEESQELAASESGAGSQSAGVRGLAFGVRREGGSVARRALVERIPSGGGSA